MMRYALIITGHIYSYSVAYSPFYVRPVLYLAFDVIISGGAGKETNPYILSVND